MSTLWNWIAGFGRFWYGFIIGDDWVAAAGVAVALGGSYGLLRVGVPVWWFGPVAVLATAAITVRRALQRQSAGAC
jgi:hypothetical protein